MSHARQYKHINDSVNKDMWQTINIPIIWSSCGFRAERLERKSREAASQFLKSRATENKLEKSDVLSLIFCSTSIVGCGVVGLISGSHSKFKKWSMLFQSSAASQLEDSGLPKANVITGIYIPQGKLATILLSALLQASVVPINISKKISLNVITLGGTKLN